VFTQHNINFISNPPYKGSVSEKVRFKEVRILKLKRSDIQVAFIVIWEDVKFADIPT